MQKIYKIVVVLLSFFVTFNQTQAQIANCCVECQADVKAISDKQVLLEKIEIPKSSVATNVSTNVYVSYRSGNSQKFWTNLAIATAGIVVSTQVGSSSTPITAGDSRTQSSSISPAIPLGLSATLIPGIWKNRPRGVPRAGLHVQHRDLEGKLTQTWEQPISSEAKNSAELLTVAIDKPLSEGSLEVYLQNGSKNEVFYWGLQTVKNIGVVDVSQIAKLALPPKPKKPINETGWCPWGWFEDGWGNCIDPDTYWSTYAGHSSTFIPGVTVTGPGNGGSGNGGWNNGLPTGDDGSGGSGSGGSGSSSNNNNNPITDRQKCIDDVYANYFHPQQRQITDSFNQKYRAVAYGVAGTLIGAWLQNIFTDWDKSDVRSFFKETWKTLAIPFGLLFLAGEIDIKIREIEDAEQQANHALDVETIRRINACPQ